MIKALGRRKLPKRKVRMPKVDLRVFEKQESITKVQEVYLKYRQKNLKKESETFKRIEKILEKPRIKSLRELHHELFIEKKKENKQVESKEKE
jgi:hypothetical protein